MAKGKQTKQKRTHKKRSTRKYRKSSRRMKGGDCGCNKGVFTGGNINPASFDGALPTRYYYPMNNEINNPSSPIAQVASRNLVDITKGGKKRRFRKIKGGSGYTLLGDAYANNPFVTFGTSDGATNSLNILNGIVPINSTVSEQPVAAGFTKYNPPLA
jgi:hypothetical protein